MGKLPTYIIVMSGLMLLFYFMGLIETTANSTLLDMLLSPEDLPTSNAKTQMFLVLSGIGAAVGAIIIGYFTKNIELALTAPFAVYLFNLMWDFLYVFNRVRDANPVIAVLFFAPVLFLFIITIVEWLRKFD